MPGLISFFRCTFLVLIGSSVIWQLNAAEFAAAVADDIVLTNLKPVISRSHHERQLARVIDLGHQRVAGQASTARQQHTAGETGQVESHAVQLTYRQPRYDDQAVGRFYSNDPVGFTVSNPMSFNRFAYANNNPYKFVDPDGRVGVLACIPAAALCGTGVQATVNAVGAIAIAAVGVLTESTEGAPSDVDSVADRSDQSGTSDQVQGFKDDLNGISTPQSDNPKVRVLTPGIKVKDLIEKAPGVTGENGRKQTENGNIGTHGSNSTQDESGKNVETLSVRERNNVWKYRESND